ncbi:PHO85 cyclin-1 [Exophiala xenobiotica]|nr:PHO85 cyclin-1 [Exophiala xenobiotica]
MNTAALEEFLQQSVKPHMIRYLAHQASSVTQGEHRSLAPSRPALDDSQLLLPSLELFIQTLVHRTLVPVPTLMTSLVYLTRLRTRLPLAAEYTRCSAHRIFLASLILAATTLNDVSPGNEHWARCTIVEGYQGFGFRLYDVNFMERQFLCLLDWNG